MPRMGALGLAPPHPRCRWEPLQTPLLGPRESLRQKQEEKQLEGGVWFRALSPQMEKIQTEPKVEGQGDGKRRGDQVLLEPQTPG